MYSGKRVGVKYTVSFRIWHWLNAIVVLGLLGTVFLRKTFLSWRTNSEILMNKLLEFDIEITAAQAKVLAKAIRAGMWEWHIILGYLLTSLVVYRVFLFFNHSTKKERFTNLSLHKKIVEILYYIFYAILLFMTVSGLVLTFSEALGLSKDLVGNIKDIHEFVFQFLLYFVVIHIVGVVIAELKDEKGIVSNMMSGER